MRPITLLLLITSVLLCPCCVTHNGADAGNAQYYRDNVIITDMAAHSGKWLLAIGDTPYKYANEVYGKIRADFKALLGVRLTELSQANGLLLPTNPPLNPSVREMRDMYIGSGYDYFINIKALEVSNGLSAIDLSNHHAKSTGSNSCRVTIEIYDLKNTKVIYSQNVTGIDQVAADDNRDFHFHDNVRVIMMECYMQAMDELKKNLIK